MQAIKTTMPWSIHDLVNMYQHYSCGHYFDKDTMRFFKSRVTDNFRRIDDNTALFITTEKGPSGVRKASVRLAVLRDHVREDGYKTIKIDIDTIGEFNIMTLYQAKKTMRDYIPTHVSKGRK